MKQFVLLLAAVFTLTATSFSQVKFGVRAGGNLSKWKTDDYKGKFKTGYEGGLVAEVAVAGPISIQSELLYVHGGTKLKNGNKTAELTTNYVAVPVLARFNLSNGLSFYAGPKMGYLLKAKQDYDGSKSDVKNQIKKTELSAVAGLEYSLPVGLSIGARYNYGITSINKDDSKIKNNSFGVSIGYKLGGLYGHK